MNINDLKRMKWQHISDWSSISKTHFNNDTSYISKNDIHNFITDYTHRIARAYNIDYHDLMKLIKSENQAFYSILDDLFSKYTGLGSEAQEFKNLQTHFFVPSLEPQAQNHVDDILVRFELLTDIEKADLLSRLNTCYIKVTKNNS